MGSIQINYESLVDNLYFMIKNKLNWKDGVLNLKQKTDQIDLLVEFQNSMLQIQCCKQANSYSNFDKKENHLYQTLFI